MKTIWKIDIHPGTDKLYSGCLQFHFDRRPTKEELLKVVRARAVHDVVRKMDHFNELKIREYYNNVNAVAGILSYSRFISGAINIVKAMEIPKGLIDYEDFGSTTLYPIESNKQAYIEIHREEVITLMVQKEFEKDLKTLETYVPDFTEGDKARSEVQYYIGD